jgi:hypothetical protein
MAVATLFGKRFLPFHEQVSQKKWEELDSGIQETILTLLHLSGLGFVVVAILLTVIPLLGYLNHDLILAILVPAVSLVFCYGLFYCNFSLCKKTGAETPWKGSLIAMGVVGASMLLSFISLLKF